MATSPTWLQSDSRARQVLEHLARVGNATVRDLVDALGVTTTAVRHQVNRLTDEGWLERSQVRGSTGRPADVFALAPQARRLFGHRAEDLSKALVQAIMNELGPGVGREVLKAAGERLAAKAREFVGDGPPEERLLDLARMLRDEGDLAEAGPGVDGTRLAVFTCPFGGEPHEHGDICEIERQTFSALVGRPLHLARRQGERQPCCVFRVAGDRDDAPRATSASSPDQESPGSVMHENSGDAVA